MSSIEENAAAQPRGDDNRSNNNNNRNLRGAVDGHRRNQQQRNQQQQQRGPHQHPRFTGSEPTLAGHIYDFAPSGNSDKFIRTTKEVALYVGRKYTKFTGDLVQGVKDLELNDPEPPPEPADPANALQLKRWELAEKTHQARTEAYADFRAGLYSIVLGQCTEIMKTKLEARAEFADASQDGLALLRLIRTITHTFEGRSNLVNEANKLKGRFYSMRQGKYEPLVQYRARFESIVNAMKEVNLSVVDPCVLEQVAVGHGRTIATATAADREEAHQKVIANQFIRGSNDRYKAYKRELENAVLNERDEYPVTLADALEIMDRRVDDLPMPALGGDGVAFVQQSGNNAPGAELAEDNITGNPPNNDRYAHIRCFQCGQMGHFANRCPNRIQQGAAMAQSPVQIPRSWVLLDNQSTVHLFNNSEILDDIHEGENWMSVASNGGYTVTNKKGTFPIYGEVWYDPKAITNILSLKAVQEQYHVHYDSGAGNKFVVDLGSHGIMEFKQSPEGLYYYDVGCTSPEENGMVLVNTVASNKTKYSNDDYVRALKARKIQVLIGRPSLREYLQIVKHGLLPNCPINQEDIMAAEDIFGPEVGCLKGKMARKKAPIVEENRYGIPASILSRYRDITLCVDVMYINGISFLVTVSKHIHFGTVEAMPNRKAPALLKAIKSVLKVYKQRGFRIIWALMDNEFAPLRGDLAEMGIGLNEAGRDEHVPQVERYIRTIKERTRATYNSLPFTRVPAILVIEMAKASVYWLNAFPYKKGVSKQLSPRTIVTGQTVDYMKHCKFEFGEYVQTHEEHDNSMQPRTVGALALRPTGNSQGNWFFMSLLTGRILNRTHATKLPMPADVIERVHGLARRQKANPGLVFLDRNAQPRDDDTNIADDDSVDETYNPEDDDSGDDDPDDDESSDDSSEEENSDGDSDDNDDMFPDASDNYQPGGDYDSDDQDSDYNPNEDSDRITDEEDDEVGAYYDTFQEEEEEEEEEEEKDVDEEVNVSEKDDDGMRSTGVHVACRGGTGGEIAGVHPSPVASAAEQETINREMDERYGPRSGAAEQETINREMDERYGPRSGAYNLRQRKRPHYNFANTGVVEENLATPQMSMRQGIKCFGEAGVQAVKKELKQVHDRSVMKACHKHNLTPEQRQEALAYLMFLKRKRCGTIKGRGCADGRPQRRYIAKEDASSPTVAKESVFLSALIDAAEGREVAVVDIPGAFMQADMDEETFVRIDGKMAELLIDIDPDMYRPYVVHEGKGIAIYVELLKALYGTLRAARLFWEKLSKQLIAWGFKINPYDSCVANKIINGTQCTVVWHVDDLKISHKEESVVDDFIANLEHTFGRESALSKSRGQIHDYLGMILDFRIKGELGINMIPYVKMVLDAIPDNMRGIAVTPAASYLYKVNDDNPVHLDHQTAELFHSLTMQLQYLAQRGRPDILQAVSFLSSRVQKPDIDDYKKLARVMKYLQATTDLILRLSTDKTGIIKWWVDASYAVHPDMRGHTGGTMSMGQGSIYSTSTKQKLVTRSSTECELVGVHDVMPQIEWTNLFLDAQGYKVNDTILYQDNLSAMLLEKNGRASSSKRTKHIHMRYFYIKDKVDQGCIRIEHCGTADMVADFFTKPLQGALFFKLRDRIMNLAPSCKYHSVHRSVLDHKQDVKASDEQHGLEPALNPVTHAKADTKEADEWIVVKRKRPP
jgi:hypothetical protein